MYTIFDLCDIKLFCCGQLMIEPEGTALVPSPISHTETVQCQVCLSSWYYCIYCATPIDDCTCEEVEIDYVLPT